MDPITVSTKTTWFSTQVETLLTRPINKRKTKLRDTNSRINVGNRRIDCTPPVVIPRKTSPWPAVPGPSPTVLHSQIFRDHGSPEVSDTVPGKFGRFGGKFVPEGLMACLSILEAEFTSALKDPVFQDELAKALRDYVGRETPLYFAERLTNYYKNEKGQGPDIYLKREDLNHGGSHVMNNTIGQAMLAKRMGMNSVVTATGAGQHGVAAAAACAKLSLDCTIFMGTKDMEKQSSNLRLMKLLGAKVEPVEGCFKDSSSQAIRDWAGKQDRTYYMPGTVVGPHPGPSMVREFQSVIGKETRRQAMEKWGGKPEMLVACVGSGSNALGLFHEFLKDREVRLVGVEASGLGLGSGRHAATLARGEVGAYHGSMTYTLQDDEGQIVTPHSIAQGLEYPGVSPELSFLKDARRLDLCTSTDTEAVDAYKRLCRLEGIFPSLEASHALAALAKLCPTLRDGTKVVVSCSCGGDKDIDAVYNYEPWPTRDGAPGSMPLKMG